MQYTIYLRTNTVNGKQYVGQAKDFKQRERQWRCLKNIYANKHIAEDREKYGLDAWAVEVLAETDSREDAWELEQRFIKDYNTLWPNGYNLENGGLIGKHHSDESKQKMSVTKKGIIPKCVTPKQVYQYTLDGELVAIWPTTAECGRNGYSQGNISECCNGKRNKHRGYIWSYILL